MNRFYLFAIIFIFSLCANAITLEQAKALYKKGEYNEAYPTFNEALAKSPKDAALNQWTGVCLYHMRQYDKAIPLLKYADSKSITEAPHYLALIAYKQYRFDDAILYLDKYKTSLEESGTDIPNSIDLLYTKAINAKNMLERVENIQIIDSINVDSDSFFKFYKISQESGSLNSVSILPTQFPSTQNTIVYQPQSKTQMVWAMNDSLGQSKLVSSALLSNNTWEMPHFLGEALNKIGNANYPYIMPDGITLYFACDGENSIGGYDIFNSRRDENGYLQPQNIGMPYNSPANDYMFVLDEITGIGWWASDRNNIEGKVTIYLFIPNEVRKNYNPNNPNIINIAKINSIKDTWEENINYNDILNQLKSLNETEYTTDNSAFSLTLPNGDIYTQFSDFKNQEAAIAMQEYIDAEEDKINKKQHLQKLRQDYANGNRSIADEILSLEKYLIDCDFEITRLRNIVITIESSTSDNKINNIK
ncbi:MAG: tetratricopeptide repeat protein [Bacteroidales bacterium]|nr:tetratricopeptide repeat protein [Bacteroidales bacterium]